MAMRDSIALVYPPYGPVGLPSLGLGLLGAKLKSDGFKCKTLFWNFSFLEALPYEPEVRLQAYRILGERSLHPWNEWPFACWLFPEIAAKSDLANAELQELSSSPAYQHLPFAIHETVSWIKENTEEILTRAARELANYKVVGINSTFYQQLPALALAKRLKQLNPNSCIVLGGANCDGDMGDAHCNLFPWIDAILKGEADETFPKLVEAILMNRPDDLYSVPGIVHRFQGTVFHGKPPTPFNKLDTSPLPDFDDYVEAFRACEELDNETLCLPLESSRGCWWGEKMHCTFCGLNANGMKFRKKSFKRFSDELTACHAKYGNSMFFMTDNILSRDYYDDLCEWANNNNFSFEMFFEIKSNSTREDVRKLVDGGVTLVQPGIESFSTSVLRLMRKGVQGIHNVAFLRYSKDFGLIPAYNILYGFPGENDQDYWEMLKQFPAMEHLQPPASCIEIEFHRFSPFHQNPIDFGLSLKAIDSYRHLYPFDQSTLNRIAYVFENSNRNSRKMSYSVDLEEATTIWKQNFSNSAVNLRYGRTSSGKTTIFDSRTQFGNRQYVLDSFPADLLQLLDSPRSVQTIVAHLGGQSSKIDLSELRDVSYRTRELRSQIAHKPDPSKGGFLSALMQHAEQKAHEQIQVGFSLNCFLEDPVSCLAELMRFGLIYVEGDRVLSLVTCEYPRIRSRIWNRLRI